MEVHVYSDHLEGFYLHHEYDKRLEEECNVCCDSDKYLGEVYSLFGLLRLLTDKKTNELIYPEKYIENVWKNYIKMLFEQQRKLNNRLTVD